MAAALTAQAGEFANVHGYLCRNVLQYVAPNVEPFTELRLLCAQIDNGVYGLREDLVKANVRAATAESRLETARGALVRIEKWFGEFPPTGKYWDEERTKPTSYSAEYGSNGERDFMRAVARTALAALPSPPITKTGD